MRNKSKVFFTGETSTIEVKVGRVQIRRYNNHVVVIEGRDQDIAFCFILPIPCKYEELSEQTIYYNTRPSKKGKNEHLFEFDFSDSYIVYNDVRYKASGAVFSFGEVDDPNFDLRVLLLVEGQYYHEANMYLYPNLILEKEILDPNLQEKIAQINPINKQTANRKKEISKPVDQLTVEDFDSYPVWEWALDEEHISHQDETWVRPSRKKNFDEELSGSFVRGQIISQNSIVYPVILNVDLEGNQICLYNFVVFYKTQYFWLKDELRSLLPCLLEVPIRIKGKDRRLSAMVSHENINNPIVIKLQ